MKLFTTHSHQLIEKNLQMRTPDKIDKALIDLLISQAGWMSALYIAMLMLVGGFLIAQFPDFISSAWVVAGVAIAVMQKGIYPTLKWLYADLDVHLRLEITVAISAISSGVFWGAAAWLFLDAHNIDLFVFVSGALLGVVTGSLIGLSARPKIWLCLAGPILLGMLLKFLMLGNWPLAVMVSIFGGGVVVLCRTLGRNIRTTVEQNFRNEELLEEVQCAKEEADRANRAKSQFMAATSHDLRQPLHAQGILLETLSSRLDGTDLGEITNKIVQSNDALNDLFSALLEVSQLDAGTVKAHIVHHPLDDIFQSAVDEFRVIAAEKNLSIESVGKPFIVYSDPILLARILRNLISNAVKFTESGGVTIDTRCEKETVSISICDTGIGISKSMQSVIFGEYTQINNKARDRNKGIGLGLAIVHRMCELLGHQIEVESVLGKGACFTLHLPLGNAEKVVNIAEEIAPQALANINVLVIDDERPILDAMQTLFADWSWRCRAFLSLQEAQAMLASADYQPDVIISDYRLSENVTGMQAIQSLREYFRRDIPALLISGDTDQELLERAQRENFYLLHKPLKPMKLKNVISGLLA
ncbi:MAG: ATP-binding protein [Pseudomonadota bacterium]